MKNLLICLSLSVIFLNSCTTRVVSANKPYSDTKLSYGKTYTFFSNNGTKITLNVERIDETTIYGKDIIGKDITIQKSEISKINKSNTLATVGLVVLAIAAALTIPAYVKNEPIGGR
ncbi:hypothetical protein GCM10010992_11090 [Cloacibacterium rupense]|uniref:Lipoprotein n=1 Tax=Cloacibacterium rupense TaxID=517423 RepID=A0ABQ2NH83_9FLAO|nr:hypothetical protein [Cloacibacterium rupense]GGP03288.1 hypothetical protein GCM10010992_11090 [Cloacibacterium rupense]